MPFWWYKELAKCVSCERETLSSIVALCWCTPPSGGAGRSRSWWVELQATPVDPPVCMCVWERGEEGGGEEGGREGEGVREEGRREGAWSNMYCCVQPVFSHYSKGLLTQQTTAQSSKLNTVTTVTECTHCGWLLHGSTHQKIASFSHNCVCGYVELFACASTSWHSSLGHNHATRPVKWLT